MLGDRGLGPIEYLQAKERFPSEPQGEDMESFDFSKRIEVRYDVDVFVAGGGPSGMAAAVTAARAGAKVFLAEGGTCLGGMGAASGLPSFAFLSDGVNFVSSGFGAEVYERVWKAGGAAPGMKKGGKPEDFFVYNPETLKRVYDDIAAEAGVDFTLQTQFLDVSVEGGRVGMAICSGKSGIFAVKAKTFIDATGDGDLCARAGAPFEKGDENGAMQPGTLCSLWCDIDWDKTGGVWAEKELPKGFAKKIFTLEDRHLPGLFRIGASSGWGNIGHTFGVDATDERSVTKALIWGRKLALEYGRFYRECLKGYEKMQLLSTGSVLGVRETRRITGDYQLNLEDFKKRAVFEDEIGRFAYPVDLHPVKPSEETFKQFEDEFKNLRYKPGENYGIPYRALLPKGLENVYVVGRCLSCDRYIQGSIRVMPGCFITGQAAGAASAIAVKKGLATREVDLKELQSSLFKIGAYLPNAKA